MGLFDFNKDGKTSSRERAFGINVQLECCKPTKSPPKRSRTKTTQPTDPFAWRKEATEGMSFGVNPKFYNTKTQYEAALQQAKARRKDLPIASQQIEVQANKTEAGATIYRYCGVQLPTSTQAYSYRTEDANIQIDDLVLVPVLDEPEPVLGVVVSVGQYRNSAVPYPLEKTKFILKKMDRET